MLGQQGVAPYLDNFQRLTGTPDYDSMVRYGEGPAINWSQAMSGLPGTNPMTPPATPPVTPPTTPGVPPAPGARPSYRNADLLRSLLRGENRGGSSRDASFAKAAQNTPGFADATFGNIADAISNGLKTASTFGLARTMSTLVGGPMGLNDNFEGMASMSQLDAHARAMGYASFADMAAEQARKTGGTYSTVGQKLAHDLLGGLTQGTASANAATGMATMGADDVTAARNAAYGPGFGPSANSGGKAPSPSKSGRTGPHGGSRSGPQGSHSGHGGNSGGSRSASDKSDKK